MRHQTRLADNQIAAIVEVGNGVEVHAAGKFRIGHRPGRAGVRRDHRLTVCPDGRAPLLVKEQNVEEGFHRGIEMLDGPGFAAVFSEQNRRIMADNPATLGIEEINLGEQVVDRHIHLPPGDRIVIRQHDMAIGADRHQTVPRLGDGDKQRLFGLFRNFSRCNFRRGNRHRGREKPGNGERGQAAQWFERHENSL